MGKGVVGIVIKKEDDVLSNMSVLLTSTGLSCGSDGSEDDVLSNMSVLLTSTGLSCGSDGREDDVLLNELRVETPECVGEEPSTANRGLPLIVDLVDIVLGKIFLIFIIL